MKSQYKEEARRLRQLGWSVREIAKNLKVSVGSVSVWVRDIELTDGQVDYLRDRKLKSIGQQMGGEANRKKFLAIRRQYQEAGRQKAREGSALHMAGCMLCWAEGGKKRNSLYFVNSDPEMLVLFQRFLQQELQVTPEMIKIHIHCHTHDAEEIRRIEQYWLDLLKLPQTSLMKTMIKKGSDTRFNILINGVCGLRVNKTELVQHIYGAIQEYGNFERPEWLNLVH